MYPFKERPVKPMIEHQTLCGATVSDEAESAVVPAQFTSAF